MNYEMLYRILGTVLSYYEKNKKILTDKQINELLEQKSAITEEMKRVNYGINL